MKSEYIIKNKKAVKFLNNISRQIPDYFKFFDYKTTVTFHLTTQEQNVNHAKIPELFGIAREYFGLEMIPDFKQDVGSKYLLKTKTANYNYIKDFRFGEEITVRIFVTEVDDVSFSLIGLFISENNLKAIGEQKIVYADMSNKPQRMPAPFKNMIETICIPKQNFSI